MPGLVAACSGTSTSGISRQLKLLRLLRLLRIMKLFRLLNASRFTHRLRVRMAVNYSTQTIVECLWCAASHACAWNDKVAKPCACST